MSGTGEIKYRWTYGTRFIPNEIDRAKWRNTLVYQVNPRLSVGIEYNPLAGKFSPLANLVAITETKNRPAIILGTSSDRIGTPSGQSFYGTLSKNLKQETGLPIAPYFGVTYGTYENRFRPIGGINMTFPKGFSSTIMFDGVKVHPLVNYSNGRHQVGFMLVEGKKAGVSYNISFQVSRSPMATYSIAGGRFDPRIVHKYNSTPMASHMIYVDDTRGQTAAPSDALAIKFVAFSDRNKNIVQIDP